MVYARCLLDKQGYKRARVRAHTHTRARARARIHRITFNTYSFSTATVVSETRLNIMLYVLCLLSYNFG